MVRNFIVLLLLVPVFCLGLFAVDGEGNDLDVPPAELKAILSWGDIESVRLGFSSGTVGSMTSSPTALDPVDLIDEQVIPVEDGETQTVSLGHGRQDPDSHIYAYWQILSNRKGSVILSIDKPMIGINTNAELNWTIYNISNSEKEPESPTSSSKSLILKDPIEWNPSKGGDFGQAEIGIRTEDSAGKLNDTYRGFMTLAYIVVD